MRPNCVEDWYKNPIRIPLREMIISKHHLVEGRVYETEKGFKVILDRWEKDDI